MADKNFDSKFNKVDSKGGNSKIWQIGRPTNGAVGTGSAGGFLQPLDSCCGAALDFGIKLIILFHSITCFFYIYTCISNVVLERPTIGYHTSEMTQTFNCAWALATVPFIIAGISGVRYQVEPHLRVYLLWLITTVSLDFVLTGMYFAKTSCHNMPAFLASEGSAFACGGMRLFSMVFMAMLFCFAFYFVFVVWSRCEELQAGGSEPAFDSLISEENARNKASIFSDNRSGIFGAGPLLTAGHPIAYGSSSSMAIGGGARIFQGQRHDINFPPGRFVP